jgi:hypothetical protein
MNEEQLSAKEAYAAMYAFLENWWNLTKSADLAGLIGSMSLLPNGNSVDASLAYDWREALSKAYACQVNTSLELRR